MYLALARKYRPQQFSQLIGQPHITRTLQNAISMNKLYPALIFSGMKGVGKTSASRLLAKALNCEKGVVTEPCNECQTCVEITNDNSTDYIEIDGASNNGVEEVRSLRETVKYKPIKNRFRVVVIDEVHMLSNSAWNALLKTIEEPPEHTYFIMATTDFHKIPATIVSRCQQFEFKRIPQEIISSLLGEICSREGVKVSDYSLKLISRAADGSLRDAKKILDQAIAISSGDISDDEVVDILGVIEEEIFINLIRGIFSKDRKSILEAVNDLAERGVDLRFFYTEFLKFIRNLIIFKTVGDDGALHGLNPENFPLLREILEPVGDVDLLRYFNAAKEHEVSMRTTSNPRIILEFLLLKLSYFPFIRDIEDVIKKAGTGGSLPSVTREMPPATPRPQINNAPPPVEQRSSNNYERSGRPPVEEPPAAPRPVAGPVNLSPEELKNKLVGVFGEDNPRLANLVGEAQFRVEGNTVVFAFHSSYSAGERLIEENRAFITSTVSRVLGRRIEIAVDINEERDRKKDEDRVKSIQADPKINSLLDKLKGKMVSIENIGGNDG